jgi:hypothetical protein
MVLAEIAIDCSQPGSVATGSAALQPEERNGLHFWELHEILRFQPKYLRIGGRASVFGWFCRTPRLEARVAADHDPAVANEDGALLGAACHGCLPVAERSCEARNLFLDRALLVDTTGAEGAGFFG